MKTIKMIMNITIFLGVLLSFGVLTAEPVRDIYVTEDFSSTTFPPPGWTISAQNGNWSRYIGNNAGGTSPEARLTWQPQFNGQSQLISPPLNTLGQNSVFLEFRHFVDHYTTPYTVGVATRSNNGAWTTVWSVNPTGNIGPQLRTIEINNADIQSNTFQFAFFFSGNSYNIDDWYIDNIKLYTPFEFDLAVVGVPGAAQLVPGDGFFPTCVIKNVGINTLTAAVTLSTYLWDVLLTNEEYPVPIVMAAGQEETFVFADQYLDEPDEMYRFSFSVTSLEDVEDGDPTNNTMDKWVNTYTTPRQNVLLEIGTGGWCPYCPGAAMGADDLVAMGYNVAVIENHNGDPYANDYSNFRNTYYGISGYPTAIFDGVLRYVGGSNTQSMYNNYLPLFQQRNAIKTPLWLDIYGYVSRDTYTIEVWTQKRSNLINENTVLHFSLTESEIQYNWQGQTHFNFVNHIMLPGVEGTPLDLFNTPVMDVLVTELVLPIQALWVPEHCELVAFIQDIETKEILQATNVALNDLAEPPVSIHEDTHSPAINKLSGNFPNPFNPSTTICFATDGKNPVEIVIYDLKGRQVRSLKLDTRSAGEHTLVFDGLDDQGNLLASGIYFYRMKSGAYSNTKKMILMK